MSTKGARSFPVPAGLQVHKSLSTLRKSVQWVSLDRCESDGVWASKRCIQGQLGDPFGGFTRAEAPHPSASRAPSLPALPPTYESPWQRHFTLPFEVGFSQGSVPSTPSLPQNWWPTDGMEVGVFICIFQDIGHLDTSFYEMLIQIFCFFPSFPYWIVGLAFTTLFFFFNNVLDMNYQLHIFVLSPTVQLTFFA